MALTLSTPSRAAAEEPNVPIVAVEVASEEATKVEPTSSEEAKAIRPLAKIKYYLQKYD